MQKLAIPANPDGTMYIYASQGENKARSYEITIIDISGQPVELDGTTAVFYVNKGKNIVQIPMEIEGNTATATLTSGACDVPGDHPCWVQVIKPDTYDLRVDGLVLRVQACDIEGASAASDEWGELTQLIVQAQQAIDKANTAAGQAETAADNANTTASTASNAASAANTAASNAESAATAANSAASQAATAASDAQTKGNYAQTQGDAAKAIVEQWEGIGLDDFVPITRTVNGKPLSSDIVLSPVDVGAQPQTTARNNMVKADASGALVAAGFNDFAPGIQYEEKGLNENEKVAIWKFADGTMITSKRRYFNSIVIDKEAGGGAVSTASYELGGIGATFTTYPYVTLTVIASDTAMQGIWIYTAVPSADMMTTYPIIRFMGPYSYTTQGWVHIQAIGRWK